MSKIRYINIDNRYYIEQKEFYTFQDLLIDLFDEATKASRDIPNYKTANFKIDEDGKLLGWENINDFHANWYRFDLTNKKWISYDIVKRKDL